MVSEWDTMFSHICKTVCKRLPHGSHMGPMNGTFLWFHSGECPSAPCQDEYEAEDNNLEPTERVDADDEFGVEADDVEDVSQLEIAPRRSRERLVTLFEWETWAWGKDVGI